MKYPTPETDPDFSEMRGGPSPTMPYTNRKIAPDGSQRPNPTPFTDKTGRWVWITNVARDADQISENQLVALEGLRVGPARPTDSPMWKVFERDPKEPTLVGLYGPAQLAADAEAYREAAGK